MDKYEIFISAIHKKEIVKINFNSKEKGIIERICIPFDFWPSRRNLKENPDRYHFYDLDSPDWKHILSILPEQLLSIEKTWDIFNPEDYIDWETKWFIPRNWGKYS